MPLIKVDLHFADSAGQDHVLRAVTVDGRGWRLHGALEGGAFSKHCHDWRGVERTMTWLRHHAHQEPIDPSSQQRRSPAA